MQLGLEGKVGLVTGASRGIGRATARLLAAEGVDLVLASRGADALDELTGELRGLGRRVLPVQADVGADADRERLVAAALAEFGRVDLLVSNATNLDVYRDQEPESALWDAHYNVDILGAVRLTELVTPGMRERGSGAIVFVSSISGMMGQGHHHGYVAMKAGLIAAGKTLAVELAPFGVRVNVVAPGTVSEPGALLPIDPEEQRQIEESIPRGRLGRPEEIASCIVLLLSEQAGWVVGHCLVADGGQFPGIA